MESVRFTEDEDGLAGPIRIIIIDNGTAKGGEEKYEALHQRFPEARIVVLADTFELEEVIHAFAVGVAGYLVKEISCEPLLVSLRLVALGEKVLPSQFVGNLCDRGLRPSSASSDWTSDVALVNLSEREVQILRDLILGHPNKVISRRLGISEATVKVYVKTVLRKLRVSNRTQAAIWAVVRGLDRAVPNGSDQSAGSLAPKRPAITGYAA